MTEQIETDKYIKCSKCKCKYINDAEHIKQEFGYNRLNIQYKTCVKCRARGKQNYKDNPWLNDYIRHRYWKPCEICNNNISKYQMEHHIEICKKIQPVKH